MIKVEPLKEHHWLHQLIGKWNCESECFMGPDQPPLKHTGTQSIRSIGGVWIQCEGTVEMPGHDASIMLITLGYDPARKRFVGTCIASMMTHLWVYDGGLDAEEKLLTLDAEGPSFTDPNKMAKYQDCIEIISKDHHILYSQILGDDGKWNRFMTANYHRVK